MLNRKLLFHWVMVPALGVFPASVFVDARVSHAQVTLSLSTLQPATDAQEALLATEASLPNPKFAQLPSANFSAKNVVPASSAEPQLLHLQLQAVPRASASEGSNFVELPMVTVQPWVPTAAAVYEDLTPSPVSVQPLIPVAVKMQSSRGVEGPTLDLNSMINKPLDGTEIMASLRSELPNLQIEQRFFESATVANPTRMQADDAGNYFWSGTGYCWQSPAFCFSPLYFEQPNYERYGQGKGKPWASTVSAAHFVGQVTTLPIAMFCTPPWTKSCTLGHHRPGDCAPIQRKPEHR